MKIGSNYALYFLSYMIMRDRVVEGIIIVWNIIRCYRIWYRNNMKWCENIEKGKKREKYEK